jgi:hypothetical protein
MTDALNGQRMSAGAGFRMVYAGKAATRHRRWLWFSTAMALVLAASCPAVRSLGGAVAEEWCESQPGGRGYAGNQSPGDAPLLCDIPGHEQAGRNESQ